MAVKVSEKEIQKQEKIGLRKIYRALGLDKNGRLKKIASEKRLEKLGVRTRE